MRNAFICLCHSRAGGNPGLYLEFYNSQILYIQTQPGFPIGSGMTIQKKEPTTHALTNTIYWIFLQT